MEARGLRKKTYHQLPQSNLSAILAGKRKISAALAGKLGKFFGISPAISYLFDYDYLSASINSAHPDTSKITATNISILLYLPQAAMNWPVHISCALQPDTIRIVVPPPNNQMILFYF